MPRRFVPAADRIAVEVDRATEKTGSGLHTAAVAGFADRPQTGVVHASLPGPYEPGVRVVFPRYAGAEFELLQEGQVSGLKLLILRVEDVLGTLVDD